MAAPSTLVWLRHDLRLTDHPAFAAAIQLGGPIIPVFIWSPEEEGAWPEGGASQWWLHQSLAALEKSLREVGSRLILRRGPALEVLDQLRSEVNAGAVVWSRRYEPASIARDKAVKEHFRSKGIQAESSCASLLHEPWTVQTKAGGAFQVFTPFWKQCRSLPAPSAPLPRIKALPAPKHWPATLALKELELEPKIPWADGFRAVWEPGESGAQASLDRFLKTAVVNYTENRNRPDLPGTSRLSPHLHFGEVSPRQLWTACKTAAESRGIPESVWQSWQFVAEVGWREFAYHLLYHFPHTPEHPLRHDFEHFPWGPDPASLTAWKRGRTGYPLVDAGMRELWQTGWMHNRVRMVVASFLVKHLLISWREGAAWFWDTLVDADLASNTLGWQWTAGCGADAAPFFRIFNPVSQGEKFDPAGAYVRAWVPELASLPAEWIHQPWAAPSEVLRSAKVTLGVTYPHPVVDHATARKRALDAFASLRK